MGNGEDKSPLVHLHILHRRSLKAEIRQKCLDLRCGGKLTNGEIRRLACREPSVRQPKCEVVERRGSAIGENDRCSFCCSGTKSLANIFVTGQHKLAGQSAGNDQINALKAGESPRFHNGNMHIPLERQFQHATRIFLRFRDYQRRAHGRRQTGKPCAGRVAGCAEFDDKADFSRVLVTETLRQIEAGFCTAMTERRVDENVIQCCFADIVRMFVFSID
ncbi:hypothetical protein D3C73_565840 [compost metagenome]